jgi:sec-independent protein translocase protein TatB
MFNVGGPEVLVILLVALVVLGPQQLPKAVRSVGSAMAELRKLSSGFQAELQSALDVSTPTTGHEHSGNATTMEQADITETVVRAEPLASADEPHVEHPAPADAASELAHHQVRHIDPIDRAAG